MQIYAHDMTIEISPVSHSFVIFKVLGWWMMKCCQLSQTLLIQ